MDINQSTFKFQKFWTLSLFVGMVVIYACQPIKEVLPVSPPTVITGQVGDVTSSSASITGQVVDDGNGEVTERGVVYGKDLNPEITGLKAISGSGEGIFSATLSNLDLNTTYHVRAYGKNSSGVGYGLGISFLTGPGKPQMGETTAKLISSFSAQIGGSVLSEQGSGVTVRGVCYGLSPSPDLSGKKTEAGAGLGEFTTVVTDLEPKKLYYFRAYASNQVGTSFGPEISITTPDNRVLDLDGNVYTFIQIGSQTWLGQDLKTTRYRNGDAIPQVSDGGDWSQLTNGAYCYYNNDAANNQVYGKLYNWYAVSDPRGICPSGWHSPAETEWLELLNFCGGLDLAGAKLKSLTTWALPNTGATNSTSFSALPGGYRRTAGGYERILLDYWCWTATSVSADKASDVGLSFTSTYSSIGGGGNEKKYGNSARCLKD